MLGFPGNTADLVYHAEHGDSLFDAAPDNISAFPSEVRHLLIFWDFCLLISRALRRIFISAQSLTAASWWLLISGCYRAFFSPFWQQLVATWTQCCQVIPRSILKDQMAKSISLMWQFKNQMPVTRFTSAMCIKVSIRHSRLMLLLKGRNNARFVGSKQRF